MSEGVGFGGEDAVSDVDDRFRVRMSKFVLNRGELGFGLKRPRPLFLIWYRS
jgi:hypothetical protein